MEINNTRYCFIALFQLFMFYLSMKILENTSLNYYIKQVKVKTRNSRSLPGNLPGSLWCHGALILHY